MTFTLSAPKLRLVNPRQHRESDLQRHVAQFWAAQYPDTWAITTHHPSGMAAGSRKHAAIFVGLGMKRGVPDLLCFAPRFHYVGLALELKRDAKQALREEQHFWLTELERHGWRCGVFSSLLSVIDFLADYHGKKP